jgi:anti-sigma regulatory factor (Ser/Thr protein kinase)
MGVPLVRLDRMLPAVPEAAREARQALGELAGHVPAHHFDDLRLLVTELVTNSLRHGRLGSDDAIHLVVQLEPTTLRVEVRDPGLGFDVPGPPPTPDRGAGWGLYLLGRIADRWGVNGRPSTCVWFEMDLSPPPDPTDDPTGAPTGGRDIENP